VKPLREFLSFELARLQAEGLERRLLFPGGIDFSSNDYLGVARAPSVRERLAQRVREGPDGAPASRLLRGNLPIHAMLEERLASFKGTEAALLFPTGYQANLGLLTSLIRPEDRAISDELNHASIIDGLRLAGCHRAIVPHLDLEAIRAELARPHPSGRTFIVTESLFSMDGDIAPLDRYAELAETYGASLIVDDAHATGVYGDARGSGLTEAFGVEARCEAIVSTCGKALGFLGAFVAGPRVLVDWLVNRARPFIFTTAPPPAMVHGIDCALDYISERPELRKRTLALADDLRRRLHARGIDTLRSEGPIVPVVIGDNERAIDISLAVQAHGYDVRAIRPPSVAPGTARLRVSVHADHREVDIDGVAEAIIASLA